MNIPFVKIIFRRMSRISPESLVTTGLRLWVLEQLQQEGEPLRWAITSVNRLPKTSEAEIEIEAVLISS